jgi:hypothetical protein
MNSDRQTGFQFVTAGDPGNAAAPAIGSFHGVAAS